MAVRHRSLPQPPPVFPPFPDWARLREDVGDAGFFAGAALAALHALARSDHPVAQLWRERLALGAAEAVMKLEGRGQDAATLRDHLHLTQAGDDPGPAGRTLQAWRLLASKAGFEPDRWQGDLPALLQLGADETVFDAIASAAARISCKPTGQGSSEGSPVDVAADIAASAFKLSGNRALALWLADAGLARRLNWAAPVPLLAAHLHREDWKFVSSSHVAADAWRGACRFAYARGAAAAFDLHADLSRRAERLLAVAPKLRGKDADAAVLELFSRDALAAQAGPKTSDRSSRRLFDRLTELGAVRELTGRATFRLYGL